MFKQRGLGISSESHSFQFKFKRGRPRKYFPQEVLDRVCSKEMLQEWAPYSLQDRATLFKKQFGYAISPSLLRMTYLRNRIRYRAAQIVYRAALANRRELEV